MQKNIEREMRRNGIGDECGAKAAAAAAAKKNTKDLYLDIYK